MFIQIKITKSRNYACDFRHRIVHVSECYKGSIHDLTVLRESGLLEYVEDNVQIIADKGYVGEP